ncbi:MAG: PH domain-containing protein [Calditrichaeota bacterium]|nr:MAG: PH domain-containing protein [Calditrichota bacterium]
MHAGDLESLSYPVGEPLVELRPSWWHYFWHLFFWWLIIPPVVAWVRRLMLVLRIYEDRIELEKGLLSRDQQIIFISDIRTIEVRQSLWQRILDIGDIYIATSGTSGYEDVALGMPRARYVETLILNLRQRLSRTTD